MDLTNNQNSAMNANNQAQSLAGQAQQRAMQAILSEGANARNMSNDAYNRQAQAAQANDAINRFNTSNRTDAGKYNNQIQGQSYEDQLKKLGAENNVTGQLNNAILGVGNQQARNTAGTASFGNSIFDSLNGGAKKLGSSGSGSGSSNGDVPTDPNQKVSDNDNLQPDPNDPTPTPDASDTGTLTNEFDDDLGY